MEFRKAKKENLEQVYELVQDQGSIPEVLLERNR